MSVSPRLIRRLPLPVLVAVLGLSITAALPASAQAGEPNGPATPEVITSTESGGSAVALTFDDGPDPSNTRSLLAVLRQNHVKAVFCLWGDHVKAHPELVREIIRDGHLLCNHTMHHDDMSQWSDAKVRADLLETSEAIHAAAPEARISYFRAPFGAWGGTPQVAAELGMQPLGWRLAIGDWEPPGTDELVRRLHEGITPGAVVLMHDGGGDRTETIEALARIIPEYKAAGWHFARPERRG